MQQTINFFFSKILNRNVYSALGTEMGKVNDFILDLNGEKPVVIAVEIKTGMRLACFRAEGLEVFHDERQNYSVKYNTAKLQMMPTPENGCFLARNFLDKQVVDINGKKAERVNDIRLGMIQGQWMVIAFDIGLRGLLRRLGVEYPAIRIAAATKKEFRNRLVPWNNVQPISSGQSDLQLSTSMSKLKTLHAADIADIIEDLDKQSQLTVFHGLDDEKAAEVLEEMESDAQVDLINTLPDDKASDLLEIMPSDEAADILEELESGRKEKLLDQMEMQNSSEIRELMEYEDKTVGSVMTKEFISFPLDTTAGEALQYLRMNKPDDDVAQYIYLTNREEKLAGVVTLLSAAASDDDVRLSALMTRQTHSVSDMDGIEVVMETLQKYNLMALPVIDEEGQLVGVTSLNDLVHEYVKLRRVTA